MSTNVSIAIGVGSVFAINGQQTGIQMAYAWATTFAPSVQTTQSQNKSVSSISANAQSSVLVPSVSTTSAINQTISPTVVTAQGNVLAPSAQTTISVTVSALVGSSNASAGIPTSATTTVTNKTISSVVTSVTVSTGIPTISATAQGGFTQQGTIINSVGTLQLSTHSSGETVISSVYLDDGSYGITQLDFTFPFYSGTFDKTKVFIGSNSYLTFGQGYSITSPTTTSFKGIAINASDNASKWVSEKLLQPGKSWVARYEGSNYNDHSTSVSIVYEITLFVDGVIQVVTGTAYGSGQTFLTNAVSGTSVSFTPAINQSYVFIPSSNFSSYTVQTGKSYAIA